MAEVNPFGAGFQAPVDATFNFEKPGDKIKGILVDRVEVKLKDGKLAKLYTLQKEDGEQVKVWGKQDIDQAMRKIVIGQWVGILFAEEKDTGKPQPYKMMKVYPGDMDPKFGQTASPTDDLKF